MFTFLLRSATSQSSSNPIALTRLGGPYFRPNSLLKLWNCRESWLKLIIIIIIIITIIIIIIIIIAFYIFYVNGGTSTSPKPLTWWAS